MATVRESRRRRSISGCPSSGGQLSLAEAGGLLGFGPDLIAALRRAAEYADRILRGTAPETMPIEQTAKFALLVNLKTAKALGITVPQSMPLRADDVIQ